MLDSEGGEANVKLWAWYKSQGFVPAKEQPGVMYGPLKDFIPELKGK